MKVVPIIQARMGATRLPGKMMIELDGIPLIKYLVDHLKKEFPDVVVATTEAESDDEFTEFMEKNSIDFIRGSEDNVLERYYEAAKKAKAEAVIRLTGDNPFTDPELLVELVNQFEKAKVAYMTNKFIPKMPRGIGAEIFTFEALEKSFKDADTDHEKEHVTPHMIKNPDKFPFAPFKFALPDDAPDFYYTRLTVDTPEDYEVVSGIVDKLKEENLEMNFKNVFAILEKYPKIAEANSSIQAKEETKKYYHLCDVFTEA